MNGGCRLNDRKVRDGTDVAAAAEIVLMEVGGRGCDRRDEQGCRDREEQDKRAKVAPLSQHMEFGSIS
jgi:hypothetical protein